MTTHAKEDMRTMTTTDLETKPKQKVDRAEEGTRAGTYYEPAVDIYETRDALVVAADMPGVPPDEVGVNVDGRYLTIEGRVRRDEYEGVRPLHVEYGVGGFYRRFMLGEAIDREAIQAEMKNGVLTVRLPKAAHARVRKVEVRAA